MILIGDFYRMKEAERAEALDVLGENVLALLQESGPITLQTLCYLLKRRRRVELGTNTLEFGLAHMLKKNLISQVRIVKENHVVAQHYALPEDVKKTPKYPVLVNNYPEAYHDLLLRYQAIRANPELATAAEDYIDGLYNPEAPETDHQVY